MGKERTNIYVDGFNLYYRALKGSTEKWLNILEFVRRTVDNRRHELRKLKYFTARVSATTTDPDLSRRQHLYLQALQTLPDCEIIYGYFQTKTKLMKSASPPPERVMVIKTEEKGSDVNLGVHLVSDAYENAFDSAIVITNDADLAEPIRIVTQVLNKNVGVINPSYRRRRGRARSSRQLSRYATFTRNALLKNLQASQFSNPIIRPDGSVLNKPASW